MEILVGTKNSGKVESVYECFSNHFSDLEIQGVDVESGISEQPLSMKETVKGSKNRVLNLKKYCHENKISYDYLIGLEGGVTKTNVGCFSFTVCCIMDKDGIISFGFSPMYLLPQKIVSRLFSGEELGPVMDEIIGESDTKVKLGAIGYLTDENINRKDLTKLAVEMALVPLQKKELYD
jgi:inosine/xanthosine triphosphatase